jgi:hypothetical protein
MLTMHSTPQPKLYGSPWRQFFLRIILWHAALGKLGRRGVLQGFAICGLQGQPTLMLYHQRPLIGLLVCRQLFPPEAR